MLSATKRPEMTPVRPVPVRVAQLRLSQNSSTQGSSSPRYSQSSRAQNQADGYPTENSTVLQPRPSTNMSDGGNLGTASVGPSTPLHTSQPAPPPPPPPSHSQTERAARAPISPKEAIQMYGDRLTDYECNEILDYQNIYFVGVPGVTKIRGRLSVTPVPQTPTHVQHPSNGSMSGSLVNHLHQQPPSTPITDPLYNSGYDNERGDYRIVVGDHFEYRYEVISMLGSGSFGQVCQVYDYKKGTYAALKVIRNKKRFHQQALVEIRLLEQLMLNDRQFRSGCVRTYGYFLFRSHLCVTFELLSINLYEIIKFRSHRGLPLSVLRRFALQIANTLRFLRRLSIIHCDLKPENILLKHQPAAPNTIPRELSTGEIGQLFDSPQSISSLSIRVIDFGSSCLVDERLYTYIQSRFYRAPEVILGLPYDFAIESVLFSFFLVDFNPSTLTHLVSACGPLAASSPNFGSVTQSFLANPNMSSCYA